MKGLNSFLAEQVKENEKKINGIITNTGVNTNGSCDCCLEGFKSDSKTCVDVAECLLNDTPWKDQHNHLDYPFYESIQ